MIKKLRIIEDYGLSLNLPAQYGDIEREEMTYLDGGGVPNWFAQMQFILHLRYSQLALVLQKLGINKDLAKLTSYLGKPILLGSN